MADPANTAPKAPLSEGRLVGSLERAKGFEPSTPTLATGYNGMRQGIRRFPALC